MRLGKKSLHKQETLGKDCEPLNEGFDETSSTIIRRTETSARGCASHISYGSRVNHEQTLANKELSIILDTCAGEQRRTTSEPVQTSTRSFIASAVNRKLTKAELVDIVAGFIIVLNALSLGFSMDSTEADEGWWLAISISFTALFWLELIAKAVLLGWRQQYCGDGSFSNIFDAALILTDTAHVILSLLKHSFETGNYIAVFRIVRLMRLARLLRLFRAPIFHDLLAMVHGLMFGMPTLAWSCVFFITFIYVVALMFRGAFGPEPGDPFLTDDYMAAWYFQTVDRSMFTTFRCSFGDCSTKHGTPIFEAGVGAKAGLMLSCVVFIASIGLFNIISAVFIERIMEYASGNSARKMQDRLKDKNRWYSNVARLLRALLKHDEQNGIPLLENMDKEALKDMTFSRSLLQYVIENDPEVMEILAELDIHSQDYSSLPETVDSSNTGAVHTTELINGLSRLRGMAGRSDIVSVDLMIRSLQKKMDDLWCWMKDRERKERSCSSRPGLLQATFEI